MDISQIYKIYLQWLSLPKKNRKLKTHDEFCSRYNLTPTQLLEFQDSGSFGEDLKEETIKWAKRQLPELLHLLYDTYTKSKSSADLRLFLEAASLLKKEDSPGSSQTNILNIFNISDEQRQKILERVAKKVNLLT